MEILERSLKKAFIDKTIPGSSYDPEVIINQPVNHTFLLNTLQNELNHCEDFFFSIAFITKDGLDAIKAQLADLNNQGRHGRLLTSTYLSFNQPKVFEDLLNIPNLEVRLSDKKGFHAKGYLFDKGTSHSLIIGSSNLTLSALKLNYEWNVKLTSYEHGEIIHQIKHHMEAEWQAATLLSPQWIDAYAANYVRPIFEPNEFVETITEHQTTYIAPNNMQRQALENLQQLRQEGHHKGLIISATGTGKTFLAAFDVLHYKPKKMLFIVHREQILHKAKESFQRIIGGPDDDYGIFSGNLRETNATYLFATIQAISKPENQQLFSEDYFDYILIDEVHRAGAQSYLTTLDYFKPNFLLGMTATPERTDHVNIFELFDYNIAYEIRLQDALEENMLCPFHYFGVTDYEKDGLTIHESVDFNYLIADERVDFLLEKIKYYGCSNNQPKGLIFCSSVKESEELAVLFNKRNIPSAYLSGQHSISERERVIAELEQGDLHYIFTVDIFNEGIDIPMINQVIMLRNTLSNIIFIQQLGRGLRKYPDKDYVTIIDFIGNYQNNYLIPMALSGDTSLNKNNLRKDTYDTHYISGLSVINFEHIAKERIFESIDKVKIDSLAMLRQPYQTLKKRLNRIPTLWDFHQHNLVDPIVIATKEKNYYQFLKKMKEDIPRLSALEETYLNFVSDELLLGLRLNELIVIQDILKHQTMSYTTEELIELFKTNELNHDINTINATLNTLSLNFYTGGDKKRFEPAAIIDLNAQVTPTFKQVMNNPYFLAHLNDLLKVAIVNYQTRITTIPFTLYQKYRRRDTLRLLNWDKQMVNQNIGGYVYNETDFIIFVTLEKGDDFRGSLVAYEDGFVDNQTVQWFTKAPRTINSPEVRYLKEHGQTSNIHFFIKKADDHGSDFYYLGKVKPDVNSIEQVTRATSEGETKSLVKMLLHLEEPVELSLFDFLTK
ncbi:DEAD/DEAH box helicase [Vagococcus xieshaowenii]|uniref:DUF3427 domain-containing protein n=1 Tax=Vagococcus xieshaowenii TaxID=2562451 RepID=A0AAJ5ED85_9ENTE|nr:DEAD/DEAH box helicase [Vagococcus xieshaowenii]QCA29390.1 DUF3427 domain-containing protein [Vagococcus xieshaowenii]TFZ39317.1 DUF3427 domain-containing protein [Vagococcus xieshaowenii]